MVVREDQKIIDQINEHYNKEIKQLGSLHASQISDLEGVISRMRSSEKSLKDELKESNLRWTQLSQSEIMKEEHWREQHKSLKSQLEVAV